MDLEVLSDKCNAKGYTQSDWTAVHKATASDIMSAMRLIERTYARSGNQEDYPKTNRAICHLSSQQAWFLAADSLSEIFPVASEIIHDVQCNCERDLSADSGRKGEPYTLDRGRDVYPYVSLHYKGRASDIITVAHEFSHAVQIHTGPDRFIPPILREIAAFIGELALLEHLKTTNSDIEGVIRAAWHRDNSIYFGEDTNNLYLALSEPDSPYTYRWNYPVARVLAEHLFGLLEKRELWQVFTGHWTLVQCMEAAQKADKIDAIQNSLPEAPPGDKDLPAALNAYRALGVMTLLDIARNKGPSENRIKIYYDDFFHHIREKTAFVSIGQDRKPVGYVTWEASTDSPDIACVKRLTAPFGDHLELIQKWKEHLPESVSVKAKYSRKAQEEKIA